jgi:murein DD-endopeptidase MepM/ murein hydrolase activator NlpD
VKRSDHDIRRSRDRRPGPVPDPESPRAGSERPVSAAPRTRADRRRAARPHPLPIITAVAVLVLAVAGIVAMAPRSRAASAPAAKVWSAVATATAAGDETPAVAPTPAFASFRGTQLLLPVPVADITVVAFHQSSFNDSYKMTPLVTIRSATRAKADAATSGDGGSASGQDADSKGVWTGWALSLWRSNVAGKSNTALDCGAAPGTPVFSPVSGTVMRIRRYKLYGKYDDFEFQIKPDAWRDVDVIVLHVTDPVVAAGARVTAGVTRIASVRNLKAHVPGLQLRTYTKEGGDHTHVQINKLPEPGRVWIVGQDPPGLKRLGS